MDLRTCVSSKGIFIVGMHKPSYEVDNLRGEDHIMDLGNLPDGQPLDNQVNFPSGPVTIGRGKVIYEIANAFPFRGVTYIDSTWADARANSGETIKISRETTTCLSTSFRQWAEEESIDPAAVKRLIKRLPGPIALAMATTSDDDHELSLLASRSCDFVFDRETGRPAGLTYIEDERGRTVPCIHDHELFEAVANNPHLPDSYKEVMVLRPGVQGANEIVGDYRDQSGQTHIYEYLRGNSYIPWGHYAANMAQDAVRYRGGQLGMKDMAGLRHLYYQRVFARLAREVGIDCAAKPMTEEQLEDLRRSIVHRLDSGSSDRETLAFSATLWGWNFGFDFAPTGYRLHASHQQVHQQNALIPSAMLNPGDGAGGEEALPPYGCGELVGEFARSYRRKTGQSFFQDYQKAIASNTRTDQKEGASSLVVYDDDNILVFVPKAQTSQWELQVMTKGPVGNILEADQLCRRSLDRGLFVAFRTLTGLGAKMITSIEYPKRFTDRDTDQHLLYSLLPRLPWSPGAFSEAQLRFISGHYPEDFAAACRMQLGKLSEKELTLKSIRTP